MVNKKRVNVGYKINGSSNSFCKLLVTEKDEFNRRSKLD